MSYNAYTEAKSWARNIPAEGIRARITEMEAAAEWQGAEFEDARVRHWRRTYIDTLKGLLPETTK